MDKEQTILNHMKTLEISREEAEQLFEDDAEDFIGEHGEEMTKNAKEVMRTIHGAEGDKKKFPKKGEPRVRAENPTKREIIVKLFQLISEFGESPEITNPEKYIVFQMDGETYEVNLIQKRKPKK